MPERIRPDKENGLTPPVPAYSRHPACAERQSGNPLHCLQTPLASARLPQPTTAPKAAARK